MKSFIFASISTFIVILIITSFLSINLLFEYVKVNEIIKDENWELTKDNRQLKQLSDACFKELKKRKDDISTIKTLIPKTMSSVKNKIIPEVLTPERIRTTRIKATDPRLLWIRRDK